jgi:hypothetical protein
MRFKDITAFEDIATHYINASCKEVCKLTDLHDFDLAYIKLDWSKRRISSRGGWYPDKGGSGISIAMSLCSKPTKGEIIRVYEYKSFDLSPIIGGFYTKNIEDKLAMHCLHEVAHAAQYWGKYLKKLDAGLPHGDVWRSIYSHLRRSILNPRLEDQTLLSKEYNNFIESIESSLQRKILRAASR